MILTKLIIIFIVYNNLLFVRVPNKIKLISVPKIIHQINLVNQLHLRLIIIMRNQLLFVIEKSLIDLLNHFIEKCECRRSK